MHGVWVSSGSCGGDDRGRVGDDRLSSVQAASVLGYIIAGVIIGPPPRPFR